MVKHRERESRRLLMAHLFGKRAGFTLDGLAALTTGPLAYQGPADFAIRHGRWYLPTPYPKDCPSLPARGCFGNSMVMATGFYGRADLKYVEGYALFPRLIGFTSGSRDGEFTLEHRTSDFNAWLRAENATAFVDGDPRQAIVVHHAWNTDPQGRLIDSTWCNGGLAYRGVVFSLERADDCCWHGDGAILADEKRGWPILREPWNGEPPPEKIQWPRSPRLEVLRAAVSNRTAYAHLSRAELVEMFTGVPE